MTSTDDGTTVLPAPGSYRLDPSRSRVTFATRHLFGLAGVTGTFAFREGEVVVADPPDASSATARIDAASFTTGNDKRDDDVRSAKWLDTAAHPDITFSSARLSRSGDGWSLQGTLTAHGVAVPTELAVSQVSSAGDRLEMTATTTVDRYAHGVTAGKGMAARRLTLTITAYGTRV